MSLPAWLSRDELKARLNRQLSGDDAKLVDYLEAALSQAQKAPPAGCGRLLVPDTEDRIKRLGGSTFLVPDAQELTSVVIDGTTYTANTDAWPIGRTEYELTEKNGLIVSIHVPAFAHRARPWTIDGPVFGVARRRRHEVVLKGTFGFDEKGPPQDLIEAIYTLAERRYYAEQSGQSDTVRVGEGATAPVYFKDLPEEVALAFRSFQLPKGLLGLG